VELAVGLVDKPDAAHDTSFEHEIADAGAIPNDRPVGNRVEHVFDGKPLREDNLRIVIPSRPLQSIRIQARLVNQRPGSAEHPVPGRRLVVRQQIVGDHPHPGLQRSPFVIAVNRKRQRQRKDKVRRDVEKPFAFLERFMDQRNLTVFEIAQSTMDEAARPARGASGDIGFVEQQYLESTQGGIAGDPGAIDPAADHDDVEIRALFHPRLAHECAFPACLPGIVTSWPPKV